MMPMEKSIEVKLTNYNQEKNLIAEPATIIISRHRIMYWKLAWKNPVPIVIRSNNINMNDHPILLQRKKDTKKRRDAWTVMDNALFKNRMRH